MDEFISLMKGSFTSTRYWVQAGDIYFQLGMEYSGSKREHMNYYHVRFKNKSQIYAGVPARVIYVGCLTELGQFVDINQAIPVEVKNDGFGDPEVIKLKKFEVPEVKTREE